MLSVVGMDPNPDVHLAADQLTENHSDCLRSLYGDQPHGVLGVDPSESRADLVIETAGGPAGAVTGGTDIGRPGFEEVSVSLAGERPQHQMLAGALRPLDQREAQPTIQVVELGRDPPARVLGESIERHRHHRFGAQARGAEQRCNRLDGRGPVVGIHDRIEHLMTAVKRGDQGIGDLAARGGAVVVGHGAKRRRWPGNPMPRQCFLVLVTSMVDDPRSVSAYSHAATQTDCVRELSARCIAPLRR